MSSSSSFSSNERTANGWQRPRKDVANYTLRRASEDISRTENMRTPDKRSVKPRRYISKYVIFMGQSTEKLNTANVCILPNMLLSQRVQM